MPIKRIRLAIGWRAAALSERLDAARFRMRYREYFSLPATSAVPDHDHIEALMAWLCRAQDRSGCGGVSACFDLVQRRWQLAYRETTGYIIPTFLAWHRLSSQQEYLDRAKAMGKWELQVQLPDGAVWEPCKSPVTGVAARDGAISIKVFNTGQVMLGYCALLRVTGDAEYAEGLRRAGDWLLSLQEPDGAWRRFGNAGANGIDSRVAWALLEAFRLTGDERYRVAADRQLQWVLRQQNEAGWFANSSLEDPLRPWTHAIAYTISGLQSALPVLTERAEQFAPAIEKACRALYDAYQRIQDHSNGQGFLPCTFDAHWQSSDPHSCLTGNAQIAILWLRQARSGGGAHYASAAQRMLEQLRSLHVLHARDEDIRGGVTGSFPVRIGYCRDLLPNWAAKFLADALIMRSFWDDPDNILG
jgi:hypothetical protein